jgi:hypothetical protein
MEPPVGIVDERLTPGLKCDWELAIGKIERWSTYFGTAEAVPLESRFVGFRSRSLAESAS